MTIIALKVFSCRVKHPIRTLHDMLHDMLHEYKINGTRAPVTLYECRPKMACLSMYKELITFRYFNTCVTVEHDGRIEEIPADTVVLAVGTRSFNPLQEAATAGGILFRLVGDAVRPAMVMDAFHEGFAAGREIG